MTLCLLMISIRLQKALRNELALLAENQGVSLQSLVRNILIGHIDTDKP